MSLNLDNVTVTVPDGLAERTILDRVSLSVEPGEIVALTGASGSATSGTRSRCVAASCRRRPPSP